MRDGWKSLDSKKELTKNRGLYFIRNKLPFRRLIKNKTKAHYKLLILDKWRYIKGAKKILDAGCGYGEFIKTNPYGIEIQGIDAMKEGIKKLKAEGYNVKYADLRERLPFKDSEFDTITCFHVLEHLYDPDNMLKEFKRVLKKDGVLLIAVPNFSFKRFYGDFTHKRPYPKIALYEILNAYKFYNIQIIKGPHLNQFVGALFFLFPKLRYSIEKFFGRISPWEHLAICKNYK